MRKPEYRCPDCGKAISAGDPMCWWCEDNSATGRRIATVMKDTQGSNIGVLFDALLAFTIIVCVGFIIIASNAK